MIGTVWTTANDVAIGVLAVVVVALVRLVWRLGDRVTRLEARLDARRAEE